jgi:RNA polymerase sigma-70 factor (ECF subfamily)
VSALPSIAPQTHRPTEADAAADLYARHSSRIFGYCLGLLRNREEAEDAVQTTFLNAYRGLRRGVRPEFEAAWLFKIAQNVCLTRRENAWRRGRIESVRDLDALQDVVAAPEHVSGQAAELTEALNRLPERYRTIILLREWHGLSYREIASETGLSEAAVEMLVFRARRALAENLERADAPRGVLSLGSLLSLLKSFFGGAGLKAVVAAGVAVTATAIAVSTAHQGNGKPARPASTPPAPSVAPAGHDTVTPEQTQRPGAKASTDQQRPTPSSRRTPPAVGTASTGTAGDSTPPPANGTSPPPPSGSSSPGSSLPAPSVSIPSVSVPDVSLPDVSLPVPAVTIPSVTLPQTPPLDVDTSDLPVTPPPLNLP